MTISTTITPIIQYNGNGVTTAFNTSFVFIAAADLKVILTDTAGNDIVQTLSTNYTVSGGSGASGTVTMIVAPALGEKLTIQRNTPKKQEVDYIENNAFPAASHELALDKLTLVTQELDEKINRGLTLSATGGLSGIEIPVQADEFIKWNALGTNLETAAIAALGAIAFVGQGMLAYTGSTTLQNRSVVGTANEISVAFGNGVSGNPTISLPSTLTLTAKDVSVGASNFKIRDTTDTTKIVTFDASGITTGTTRTLTLPNQSGTIALLSDISGGVAPATASYLTLTTNGTLTNERVLTAGSNISFVDGGAGSTLTINATGSSPTGSVINTQSAILTSTFSLTSTTFTDITGLSVSITPSSTSSKILVFVDVQAGGGGSEMPAIQIVRGSTPIGIGTAASPRISASASGMPPSADAIIQLSAHVLDSPATTSATTYKVQLASIRAGTVCINRSNTDSASVNATRTVSTITVMEIK